MKKALLSAILSFSAIFGHAQVNKALQIGLDARVDFGQTWQEAGKAKDASGFNGKNFNLSMEGELGGGFSFSFRHRLNRLNSESFLNATDWLELNYNWSNWKLSGGKQVVHIGGWDYDRPPIDLYFYSEYLCNIACYQLGVSATWFAPDRADKVVLQVCQSPFQAHEANAGGGEMLSYNLFWSGNHGAFSSHWSVNMLECLPGKFINYISLGNKLTFSKLILELDLMNRAVDASEFFFEDITVGAKALWFPAEPLGIFLKGSYDRNDSQLAGDWCVVPGTSIARYGGGLEFFPLKGSRNVRIHLSYCRDSGTNPSPWGFLQDGQSILEAGLTWKMSILDRH